MSPERSLPAPETKISQKHPESRLRKIAKRVLLPLAVSAAFFGASTDEKSELRIGVSVASAETGGYPDAEAICLSGDPNNPASSYGKVDGTGYWCEIYNWGYVNAPQWSPRGYGYRNCTDWAAFRAEQATGKDIPNTLGNANTWDDNAPDSFDVDAMPEPGDVAQSNYGMYGHVGVVEAVNTDQSGAITSIEVSEYNRNNDGEFTRFTYSQKNSQGLFVRFAGATWDNFIDINGEGTGINGEALQGANASPEAQNLGDPFGNIDRIRRYPGGLRVEGWVMDPDTANPINGDLYSGSGYAEPEQYEGGFYADQLRNDLNSWGNGNYHGFSKDFLINPGTHNICLYGINVGGGDIRRVSCAEKSFSGNAFGRFEFLYRSPGGLMAKGWAIDPDTDLPIKVYLFDSEIADTTVMVGGTTSNKPRQDVVDNLISEYVGFDRYKGFEFAFPIGGGLQRICAFAENSPTTPGNPNTKIGCGEVYVTFDPKGSFDSAARVTGGVALKGWALDPDTKDPINVDFYGGTSTSQPYYIGGASVTLSRPDIVPTNPGYGDLHGFSIVRPLPAGVTRICAYGINKSGTQGTNKLIGCRNI